MSHLIARLLLAIFVIPSAGLMYTLIAVFVMDQRMYSYYRSRQLAFLLAGGATMLFVMGYWYLLWRRSVVWTVPRRVGTLVLLLVSLALSICLGLVCTSVSKEFSLFIGTTCAPLLWLIGTTFIWRESGAERAARVGGTQALVCPTCGYNLTGLTEPRCPECGTRFTLDQLFASQPARATAELDK